MKINICLLDLNLHNFDRQRVHRYNTKIIIYKTNQKKDILEFIKIKNFALRKTLFNRMKRLATNFNFILYI